MLYVLAWEVLVILGVGVAWCTGTLVREAYRGICRRLGVRGQESLPAPAWLALPEDFRVVPAPRPGGLPGRSDRRPRLVR